MTEFLRISIVPIVLTLAAFRVGQILQNKWKTPLFNPTLIGTVLVIAFLLVAGMDMADYTVGTAKLSWLMTPATISLAIPMYEQFQMLRKNLKAIVINTAESYDATT